MLAGHRNGLHILNIDLEYPSPKKLTEKEVSGFYYQEESNTIWISHPRENSIKIYGFNKDTLKMELKSTIDGINGFNFIEYTYMSKKLMFCISEDKINVIDQEHHKIVAKYSLGEKQNIEMM